MKKNNVSENYLEKIPCHCEDIKWTADNNGLITLEIENKGIFNHIAQKFFKKPKISYIHLDETGSFLWSRINGAKNIEELGKELKAHFGDAAHPLYERLAKYFQILDSYNFINWK